MAPHVGCYRAKQKQCASEASALAGFLARCGEQQGTVGGHCSELELVWNVLSRLVLLRALEMSGERLRALEAILALADTVCRYVWSFWR